MYWTAPNVLTVVRLVMAPCFGLILLMAPGSLGASLALVVFIAAAITDYLDGFLARHLDQTSNFGKLFDPIADKAMIIIALSFIGLNDSANYSAVGLGIPTICILFREVFISGLREFFASQARVIVVSRLAKYKTAFQMLSISVILAAQTDFFSSVPILFLGHFLLWIAARLKKTEMIGLGLILRWAFSDWGV